MEHFNRHRNRGSVMSMKNRLAAARWVIKNKPHLVKDEHFIRYLRLGVLTKEQVYGFHPTKGSRPVDRTQIKLRRKQAHGKR